MVELKEIHPGVLMARILLSADVETALVRDINCGPVPCTVLAGESLATAESADNRTDEVQKASSDSCLMS